MAASLEQQRSAATALIARERLRQKKAREVLDETTATIEVLAAIGKTLDGLLSGGLDLSDVMAEPPSRPESPTREGGGADDGEPAVGSFRSGREGRPATPPTTSTKRHHGTTGSRTVAKAGQNREKLLRWFARNPHSTGAPMKLIAEQSGISKGSIYDVVNHAERDGVVTSKYDGKLRLVAITAAGREAVEEMDLPGPEQRAGKAALAARSSVPREKGPYDLKDLVEKHLPEKNGASPLQLTERIEAREKVPAPVLDVVRHLGELQLEGKAAKAGAFWKRAA